MSGFAAVASIEDGRTVVSLSGECDLAVRAELEARLREAIRPAVTVVVDLGQLTFLDSSGIHELVRAHQAALEVGARLYVRNATDIVATVLDVTGVGEVLTLTGDDGMAEP